MPSVSTSQRRLMAAAEHGARFPLAEKVRESMSQGQLHEFAATKERGLPRHVQAKAARAALVGGMRG